MQVEIELPSEGSRALRDRETLTRLHSYFKSIINPSLHGRSHFKFT